MGLLVVKAVTYLIIIIFICALSCMCLYHYSGICLQGKRIITRQATSVQVKPLADLSGHTGEEKVVEDSKN